MKKGTGIKLSGNHYQNMFSDFELSIDWGTFQLCTFFINRFHQFSHEKNGELFRRRVRLGGIWDVNEGNERVKNPDLGDKGKGICHRYETYHLTIWLNPDTDM